MKVCAAARAFERARGKSTGMAAFLWVVVQAPNSFTFFPCAAGLIDPASRLSAMEGDEGPALAQT